jgi:hypothetical protein
VEDLMARRGKKKASLSTLKRGTHKGRPTGTTPSLGQTRMDHNSMAKLVAPMMMHKNTPTPHGPEHTAIRGSR